MDLFSLPLVLGVLCCFCFDLLVSRFCPLLYLACSFGYLAVWWVDWFSGWMVGWFGFNLLLCVGEGFFVLFCCFCFVLFCFVLFFEDLVWLAVVYLFLCFLFYFLLVLCFVVGFWRVCGVFFFSCFCLMSFVLLCLVLLA